MVQNRELDANPAAKQLTEEIRKMLLEDISKAEIREKIKEGHPTFPSFLFEMCFTEAFTSL